MDISEGNFCARIYNEKSGAQRAYPDVTRPLTPAIRTPQYGHNCLGKKLPSSASCLDKSVGCLFLTLRFSKLMAKKNVHRAADADTTCPDWMVPNRQGVKLAKGVTGSETTVVGGALTIVSSIVP